MSAHRIGIIRASLEFVPNAVVAFDRKLEVSLDCHVCQRRDRTVIFRPGETHGICTPTKHAFPGRILNVESRVEGNAHIAIFLFEYEHEPFRDTKYPDERRYATMELGAPSWARVSFDVTCPACGERSQHSTQNNIVRPWRRMCKCGRPLYAETAEMPQLSWRPAEPT